MYSFGSGVLLGTRTDIANATPLNFGLVQEVTIDESATIKELTGQFQRPVAIARGTIKTTGKAKVARISGIAFASLYYGFVPAVGQVATSLAEGPTPIPTTPFTITVANSATFIDDAGVINAATGLPMALVASGPAAGQYSVNLGTGVYTFSSADNVSGVKVLISYTYNIAAAGQKFTISNQLLGTTPTFKAKFYTTFQGQAISLQLNNCTSNKLSFHTKLEDFIMPEFDFSCFADAAGNVMTWSFAEVS
ncbi:MAG: hypothetical protein ACREDT_07980 [Methylocella sp.]